MKKLKIGLFGFGVVGEGIYNVLTSKQHLGIDVAKIVIKDETKTRNAPTELFSTQAYDILNDDSIDLVVELIDDADAAFAIVQTALKRGKSVVSANKKMIAEHHEVLIQLSRENGVSFLYEAAVCGSVPIIRNLEEYFDNNLLNSVHGIVNGSTNFILCKMYEENQPYDEALKVAQESGFAESDPSLDVEGIDASFKLGIIALHAFGQLIKAEQILRKGITSLHPFDFEYAKEKGQAIKLVANGNTNEKGELESLSVFPTFVKTSSPLGQTSNEYNGVIIGSTLADEQFLYGKGAGRYPTSSAVLSDISAFKYGYKYEYKKGVHKTDLNITKSGLFYVSFDKIYPFDSSVFSEIHQSYIGEERAYCIGKIEHKNLIKHRLLDDLNLSLVSYN